MIYTLRVAKKFLILIVLSLSLLVCAFEDDDDARFASDYVTPTLHPLHIDDYESATGFSKRNGPSFLDEIKPSNQSHLSYGSPRDDGAFMVANMTLQAPNGTLLVTMERFEALTKAVDCMGDDGQLSLTFKSKDAFEFAQKTWKYINDDDDANFLLITNHDGCGPANERQVYRITKVDSQEDTLVTIMKAIPEKWKDIAETFELNFGTTSLTEKGYRRLRVRGIGNLASLSPLRRGVVIRGNETTALEARDKEFKAFSVGFQLGDPKKNSGKLADWTKQPPRWAIQCEGCFLKAKVSFGGRLKTLFYVPYSLELYLTLEEFRLFINYRFELTIEKDYQEKGLKDPPKKTLTSANFEHNLYRMPIPGLGVSIPNIFSAGVTGLLMLRGEIQTFGRFVFNTGADAKLAKGARLVIDLVFPSLSRIEGLHGSDVDWFFKPKTSGNGELNFLVYPGIGVNAGVTLLGNRNKFEAENTFRFPAANADIILGYDAKGWCKAGGKKSGVKVGIGTQLALWIKVPKISFTKRAIDGLIRDPPRGIANVTHELVKRGFNSDDLEPILDRRWGLNVKNFFQKRMAQLYLKKFEKCIEGFWEEDPTPKPKPKPKTTTKKPGPTPKPNPNPPTKPPKNKKPNPSPGPAPKPPKDKNPNPPAKPAPSKPPKKPVPKPTEKPDNTYKIKGCKLIGNNVRYRTCASTDDKKCPALGEWPEGHVIKFSCWVTGTKVKDNSKEEGSSQWGQTSDKHYISLRYVDAQCGKHIPPCKTNKKKAY